MLRNTRLTVVHGALVLFALALVARSAWVQLWQGDDWKQLASRQHYASGSLPAPRGEILDVSGVPLAQTQARLRLAVVPEQVRDPRLLDRSLQRLGVDRVTRQRTRDRRRKWVPLRGTYLPSDVGPLAAMPGVHVEVVGGREYAPSEGLRKIVGRTNSAGSGLDGIESMLDSLLRGERGSMRVRVGARGQRYESPEALTTPPRSGHSVVLTISYVLQDICDRALDDAVTQLGAIGGDIVVVDPLNGEVRCLASRRSSGVATGATALVDPFEPGSTLKPLYAAALLETDQARLDDVVETFGGRYRTPGRVVTDVHGADRMSLADVIRHSSNVGIVRFIERLSPGDLYVVLRDFGFGMPTGVAYPSEASGVLRNPRHWSVMTPASLAMGYEVMVTPLQLAMAYAALANDGVLLSPALVKAVRDPDGKTVYEHRPTPVRRVVRPATARTLRRVLASVVDSGTATDAQVESYAFGGKTGTAKRVVNGRYQDTYTSSFVGIFPANDPQYVVLVKLDDPKSTYYGGKAAAPVARAVVEATIAARDAALDRGGLARARYVPPPTGRDDSRARPVPVSAPTAPEAGPDRHRYALVDTAPPPRLTPVRFDITQPVGSTEASADTVVVPDVRRLPLRVAARELHRAGLRVTVVNDAGYELSPAPGVAVPRGTMVRIGRP